MVRGNPGVRDRARAVARYMRGLPTKVDQAMTPEEILDKAADLIAENGWTQGAYREDRDGVTCYCALGAINEVSGLGHVPLQGLGETQFAISFALSMIRGRSGMDVITWNDFPGQTKENVVRALKNLARTGLSAEQVHP